MAPSLGSNSQPPRTGSTEHLLLTPPRASLALEQSSHAHKCGTWPCGHQTQQLLLCVLEVNTPKIIWELCGSPWRWWFSCLALKGCAARPAGGGWWQGTAKGTRSRMAQKGCKGQVDAKHNSSVLPDGSSPGGRFLVESGWFIPVPDTEMGWEAEMSGVGEPWHLLQAVTLNRRTLRARDPQLPNAVIRAVYF